MMNHPADTGNWLKPVETGLLQLKEIAQGLPGQGLISLSTRSTVSASGPRTTTTEAACQVMQR